MKTETINVYKFSELSEKVQAKVIERRQERNASDFESSNLTDQFDEIITEKGYTDMILRWSLGWCQGDGVAFYGKLNRDNLITIGKRVLDSIDFMRLPGYLDIYDVEAKISGEHNHYHHWNSMEVDIYANEDYHNDEDREFFVSFDRLVQDDVKTISIQLEKIGYEEITANSCEETAKEELYNEDEEEGERYLADGRLA
jgi:hypothetical protein